MPRAPRAIPPPNGAVPAARRGTFLADDPRRAETATAVADEPDPTTGAMAASNPVLTEPAEPESAASSGLDGQPLVGSTGGVVGAVGRPEMLPDTIEAVGPNGELITLKRDEHGQYVTINTNIPPPPISAEVDHPILQQLRSRTSKPKGLVQRAPAYNHRMLWYMKLDGEIVPGQGDPGNRAYYEDKGYVVLRDDEEKMWLRGDPGRGIPPIRRMVIAEQRRRAQLITVIRSIAKRNPSVEMTGDLSITPTEELEEMLTELRGAQGVNFRLLEARQRGINNQDEKDDQVLSGLEVGIGHDLYRKMARSREQSRIGGLNRQPSEGALEMSTSGQMMPGE